MEINLTRFLNFAIKPHGILICSMLLCFLAWVFPGFGFLRKGFEHRDSLLSVGALTLYMLYGSMIFLAYFGFIIGSKFRFNNRRITRVLSLDRNLPYYLLTAVAMVGFAYFALYLIKAVGISGMVSSVGEGQANDLKEALYADYAIGPLSLRYVVILAGGVAIFRMITGISRSIVDLANIGALLLTGLASSRLSVVTALLLGIGLYVSHERSIRLPIWQPIVAGCAFFALLAVYNSTRNSNFYAERGNDGMLGAGLSEMVTYLGTPFQGALSSAGNLDEISSGADPGDVAGIELSLTTNSALTELLSLIGYWCFPVLIMTTLLAGFFMGLMNSLRGTYFGVTYFVFLYGLSELWRIYMFDKGIFVTLMFFAFSIPYFVLIIPRRNLGRAAADAPLAPQP